MHHAASTERKYMLFDIPNILTIPQFKGRYIHLRQEAVHVVVTSFERREMRPSVVVVGLARLADRA